MKLSGTELLSTLNPQQRNAVTCTEGPLLVLAGAGTGKTKVISTRVAYLLQRGVRPNEILAVTFTRKAAVEMNERIVHLLNWRPYGLTVSTFHSLGFRILREMSRGQLRVFEEKEKQQLIQNLLHRNRSALDPERTVFQISRAKNTGISPATATSNAQTNEENEFALCYTAYNNELRARAAIDLDDMISLPLELLRTSPARAKSYGQRWRYILVDEYQDTNQVQYELMRSILGQHQNVCVVGDDNQSIYGFRGASVEKILSFRDDFPNATDVALELNYRSHTEIISLANSIISGASKRHPKRLVSHLGPGARIEYKRLPNQEAEATYVANQIANLTSSKQFSFRDVAVILRVTKHAEIIRRVFKNQDTPFTVGKGTQTDDVVTIMTIHQAKGLEFPVIFLPALEENTLPHYLSVKEGAAAIEEERRLLYVAVTRAKKLLFLSTAAARNGKEQNTSRFLCELSRTTALRWRVDLAKWTSFFGRA